MMVFEAMIVSAFFLMDSGPQSSPMKPSGTPVSFCKTRQRRIHLCQQLRMMIMTCLLSQSSGTSSCVFLWTVAGGNKIEGIIKNLEISSTLRHGNHPSWNIIGSIRDCRW